MNFHVHRKELRSLLHSGWRKKTGKRGGNTSTYNAGCYFISQKRDDSTFKMGLSNSIYSRLSNQYLVCFPFKEDYYVKYLVICGADDTRELEVKLAAALRGAASKKDSLDLISKDSYSKEWFLVSRDARISSAIFKVCRTWKKWSHVVKFEQEGWRVISVGDKLSWKYVPVVKDVKVLNGIVVKPAKVKENPLAPYIAIVNNYLRQFPEGENADRYRAALKAMGV